VTYKTQTFRLNFLAGALGNLFEHYDQSLFAFLAPFLAPLFFSHANPLTALILTFGMLPLGIISRPIGAIVFGKIGDQKGRKQALFLTLIGMAATTFAMGCLPTYEKAGILAPIFLAIGRLLQNFFAAGETTGSALLILESCDEKKRSLFSSLYDSSTILGILIASLAVTLLSYYGGLTKYWRLLYFCGAMTAFVGLIIRLFTHEAFPEESTKAQKREPIFSLIWQHRRTFIAIIFITGFSYTIYQTVTSLMNGFLPLISSLTKTDAMRLNTLILIIDFCLLPLFGYLAMRFSKEKVMLLFSLLAILLSPPLFHFLANANFFTATLIRLFFVVIGVGFCAPIYAYLQEITPYKHRYTLISLGTAIGSQLIGGSCTFCSLYLYKQTSFITAPAIYLSLTACFALFSITKLSRLRSYEAKPSV